MSKYPGKKVKQHPTDNRLFNCTTVQLFIASYYRHLSADIKMKNYKIKTSFVKHQMAWSNNLNNFHWNFRGKLSVIFQYDWEPVLIQRILFGFEAILEKCYLSSVCFFSANLLLSLVQLPSHSFHPCGSLKNRKSLQFVIDYLCTKMRYYNEFSIN